MPLPEPGSFLQTPPAFPVPRDSQQAGAWLPPHPTGPVSAGVVLCGEESAQQELCVGVCAELGPLPASASSAQAVPLCRPPAPVPSSRALGGRCQLQHPWGAQTDGGSQGVTGPGRVCGEVTVPPSWVSGAGVAAGEDLSRMVCCCDRCCRVMKRQRRFRCLQGGGDVPGWPQLRHPRPGEAVESGSSRAGGQDRANRGKKQLVLRGWGVAPVRQGTVRDGRAEVQVPPQSFGQAGPGPAVPRAPQSCGTWRGLPRRVLRPAGGRGPAHAVPGRQIRGACAGMLFLSGALEQRQRSCQGSDAAAPGTFGRLLRQAAPCPGAVPAGGLAGAQPATRLVWLGHGGRGTGAWSGQLRALGTGRASPGQLVPGSVSPTQDAESSRPASPCRGAVPCPVLSAHWSALRSRVPLSPARLSGCPGVRQWPWQPGVPLPRCS